MNNDLIIFINIIVLTYVLFFVPYKHIEQIQPSTKRVIRYKVNITETAENLFKSVDEMLWSQILLEIDAFLESVYYDNETEYKAYLKSIEHKLSLYVLKDIHDLKKRRTLKVEVDNILFTLRAIVQRDVRNKNMRILESNYDDYYNS